MTMTARLPVGQRSNDAGTLRFDHLELWGGNAKQAAECYITAFGFRSLAYAGPETGLTDRASYVVAQGDIRLVLTSALRPGGPINEPARGRKHSGYMLQIFTKPLQDRPTLFFKIIQRHGARVRQRQLQSALRLDRKGTRETWQSVTSLPFHPERSRGTAAATCSYLLVRAEERRGRPTRRSMTRSPAW
jgi:hypothetical protein